MSQFKVETIVCRAKLDGGCYDGSPMTRQIGDHGLGPDDLPGPDAPDLMMSEDGTYDGQSIVCDACYAKLCPLTKSGAALLEELPEAISLYHANVKFLREQDDPAKFVAQAERAMEMVLPGSPYWMSARAMRGLAQAEVDRRAAA